VLIFLNFIKFITNGVHNLFVMTQHVAKIIEIIGSSDKGWEDAAQVAVDEAKKTLHGIHGIEVVDMTANVDPGTGKISKYRTCVKISFAIDSSP
jgi:flavin-binding protein dodecin